MQVVVDRGKAVAGAAETVGKVVGFVAAAGAGVERVKVGRVRDVQLGWGDADDGAVDFVELLDVRGELALEEDVVVELVPVCQRGESGAGEPGEGMEVKAVEFVKKGAEIYSKQ